MLLYIAKVAVFGTCLALGFGLKSADVSCHMTVVTVPVAEQVVPCDGAERHDTSDVLSSSR